MADPFGMRINVGTQFDRTSFGHMEDHRAAIFGSFGLPVSPWTHP